jgi:hypothetical protein
MNVEVIRELVKPILGAAVGVGCYYLGKQSQSEAIEHVMNNPNLKSFNGRWNKTSGEIHAEFYRNPYAQQAQGMNMMMVSQPQVPMMAIPQQPQPMPVINPMPSQTAVVNTIPPAPLVQNPTQPKEYGLTYDMNTGEIRRVELY